MLSDKQIMKALHRCAAPDCKCNNCVAHAACADGSFIFQVISLIKRREDTIESLRRNIDVLKKDRTFKSRWL